MSARGRRQRRPLRWAAVLVLLALVARPASSVVWTPGTLKFDFRPQHTLNCGDDYITDDGSGYSRRPEGLTYGWLNMDKNPKDLSDETRHRNASASCVDTGLIHMARYGVSSEAQWGIALPNGEYTVSASCGDPENMDSLYFLSANGVTLLGPYTPTGPADYAVGSAVVKVTDGQLLVTSQPSGINTKLQWLQITPGADDGATVGPVTSRFPPGTSLDSEHCMPYPSRFQGRVISPLSCPDVRVAANYTANCSSATTQPGVLDATGVSTGFTMYVPWTAPESGGYYNPSLLHVQDDALLIDAQPGDMAGTSSLALNALGVGLPLPLSLAVQLTLLPPEVPQTDGCLFVAEDDANFARICVRTDGTQDAVTYSVSALYELRDETQAEQTATLSLDSGNDANHSVSLRAEIDAANKSFSLLYAPTSALDADPTAWSMLLDGSLDESFFNNDAASIDFTLGTRVFGGVHVFRSGALPATFAVSAFNVSELAADSQPTASPEEPEALPGVEWDVADIGGIAYPTDIAIGQNHKMYVTAANGTLTVVQLDDSNRVEQSRAVYAPVGARLVLGVAIQPDTDSTGDSSDVVLWLSHSDVAKNNASANSGIVSRVSGAAFENRDDVITGIPRALANHALNNCKFGPDGKLYFSVGANTAGGTPNTEDSDFGFRPEQTLSSAILQADVLAPGFSGECLSSQDSDEMDLTGVAAMLPIPDGCDVKLYATGIRNAYSHTWRRGVMFATDNGVGGDGTFPLLPDGWQPGDACVQPVTTAELIKSHNTGTRSDLLHRVEEGSFHGHPNPARSQCTYYGGNPTSQPDYVVPGLYPSSYALEMPLYPVGVPPVDGFVPAMYAFGVDRSFDGITTYRSESAFCGKLKDSLITVAYSNYPAALIVQLDDEDDSKVVGVSTLAGSTLSTGGDALLAPLTVETDDAGNVFVGEFGGENIKVFSPRSTTC